MNKNEWDRIGGLRCAACYHNEHWDFDKLIIYENCRHAGGWATDYDKCECNKFVPFDNLLYLTWKYEQANPVQ